MKKYLFIIALLTWGPSASAFQWSVNEYIEKCSVVHQKSIAESDMETVGYCMGVLKGAFAGILVTKSLETGELEIPDCISLEDKNSYWEIQKDVLATMRLKFKHMESATEPNTANAAVVFALIELRPCLLD